MNSAVKLLRWVFLTAIVFLLNLLGFKGVHAEENPFPLLPGLEASVEFWKLVFTRYGSSEMIFHDPDDPLRIYRVLPAAQNVSRRWIHAQRRRILAESGGGEGNAVRAQRGVKERFASGLARSTRYIDQIKEILREEGVPEDLAYLPLVESAFNVQAHSRAGARGLWQFMPATGRRFLRVSSLLDERKDPLESTRAAARYLKENYRIFHNWPLAITAYNRGRRGMQRAVSEVGSRDLAEIIRGYDGRVFGFASKSFYAEFLAAVEIAKRGDEFFPDIDYDPPMRLEEIHVERTIHVADLLRRASVSREEFFAWNPALSARAQHIPAGYRLKVPSGQRDEVHVAYLETIGKSVVASGRPSPGESAADQVKHRVSRGETLSEIARLYEVSMREIQRSNDLQDVHSITAGEYLTIPLQ